LFDPTWQKAALTIQNSYREFLARKKYIFQKNAIILQNVFRCILMRKCLKRPSKVLSKILYEQASKKIMIFLQNHLRINRFKKEMRALGYEAIVTLKKLD
jgi:IQ calmodulin-binding motif